MAKTTTTRTPEEIQGEINALKQLLTNTDYQALKHSEGEISDTDYEETRELRRNYRERINELEEELKTAEI